MLEHMKHLRFVHNAQTILCLAVTYLIYSSWTSGPEVLGDLDGFLQTMQRARRVIEEPEHITLLVPSVENARDRRSRELSAILQHEVTLIAPFVLEATTPLPAESAPIGRQWTALQEQQWTLMEIEITDQDFRDVRDWYARWYDRWGVCVLYFERDRRPRRDRFDPRSPHQTRRRSAPPEFRIMVSEWGENPNVVSAMIELIVYVPESRRHPSCRRSSNPRDYRLRDEWILSSEAERFGPYQLSVRSDTIQLPRSTFSRYHYLQTALDSIGHCAPNEVREWAMTNRTSEIREREPRLFGTLIRGEDVGVVGLGATLAVHAYMFFTLLSLRYSHDPRIATDRPFLWMGAMRTWIPTMFTFVTLALCPAVVVGVALWRLTSFGTLVSFLWFAILLTLGMFNMYMARHLGDGSTDPRS